MNKPVICLGAWNRKGVYRGTRRIDTIKYNEVVMEGHLQTVKRNVYVVESTHFRDEVVDGHNPMWLVAKNGYTLTAVHLLLGLPMEVRDITPLEEAA